jgi:hypothetical protein
MNSPDRSGMGVASSRRASLFHHFHQNSPSLSWIAYRPHECDAGTTDAIRRVQVDMKTQAIHCCHRGFR